MIEPAFQQIQLDGRIIILKTEAIEVGVADATNFKEAKRRYIETQKRHPQPRTNYWRHAIACMLYAFHAETFHRNDVYKWCAFCNVPLTHEEISRELHQLSEVKSKPPVQLVTGKGPKATWQADSDALEAYLSNP